MVSYRAVLWEEVRRLISERVSSKPPRTHKEFGSLLRKIADEIDPPKPEDLGARAIESVRRVETDPERFRDRSLSKAVGEEFLLLLGRPLESGEKK